MENKNCKADGLRGAVALSHLFLRQRVRVGDRVVDATCGNGRDTLLLAQLVGPGGRVWGLDVQESAIVATRDLLSDAGCLDRTELVCASHERLADIVREPVRGVVFNLGYLPGGDRTLVTAPAETVSALRQAAALLLPGGIITVCLYTSHPGALEECTAVEAWGGELLPSAFNVWRSRQLNRPETAPYLVVVEKAGEQKQSVRLGGETD